MDPKTGVLQSIPGTYPEQIPPVSKKDSSTDSMQVVANRQLKKSSSSGKPKGICMKKTSKVPVNPEHVLEKENEFPIDSLPLRGPLSTETVKASEVPVNSEHVREKEKEFPIDSPHPVSKSMSSKLVKREEVSKDQSLIPSRELHGQEKMAAIQSTLVKLQHMPTEKTRLFTVNGREKVFYVPYIFTKRRGKRYTNVL